MNDLYLLNNTFKLRIRGSFLIDTFNFIKNAPYPNGI